MRVRAKSWFSLLVAAAVMPAAHAAPSSDFCKVLRAFVESVEPDEARTFIFRTSWGSNFKDAEAEKPAFFAKRCEHDGYEPAKKVCAYLVEHGSTEFTWINVKDTISCLSGKTKFDPALRLNSGEFRFSYGSEHRGAWIDISFQEDQEVGGMAFRLTADGY